MNDKDRAALKLEFDSGTRIVYTRDGLNFVCLVTGIFNWRADVSGSLTINLQTAELRDFSALSRLKV